jgi:translation initiation factor 1
VGGGGLWGFATPVCPRGGGGGGVNRQLLIILVGWARPAPRRARTRALQQPNLIMNNSGKVPTDGGQSLGQNPFGALNAAGLPNTSQSGAGAAGPERLGATAPTGAKPAPVKTRGRVDIKRTTAGRGGKTVTLVTGFVGIGLPEKEQLAKKMRNACGCGGTVKDGDIEIQGDQRDKIAAILTEAGFRPVFAGG